MEIDSGVLRYGPVSGFDATSMTSLSITRAAFASLLVHLTSCLSTDLLTVQHQHNVLETPDSSSGFATIDNRVGYYMYYSIIYVAFSSAPPMQPQMSTTPYAVTF